MLLDDRQIALNELLVIYQEAADHFEDAANYIERSDTRRLFTTIRAGHDHAVDILSELVRQTGALPRAQNADREQARQIFTHVKAALSEDEHDVFLIERIKHEKKIELAIREALQLPFNSEARGRLETLQTREALVLAELEDALNKRESLVI